MKIWRGLRKVNGECRGCSIIESEYDQEISQSQTADKPVAPWGWATQKSWATRKTKKQSNQLSLPHQDDWKTRMDTRQRTAKHRTITESHNGRNNQQRINNNRTTAFEWKAIKKIYFIFHMWNTTILKYTHYMWSVFPVFHYSVYNKSRIMLQSQALNLPIVPRRSDRKPNLSISCAMFKFK